MAILVGVGVIGAGANTRLKHIPGLRTQNSVEVGASSAYPSREIQSMSSAPSEVAHRCEAMFTAYDNVFTPPSSHGDAARIAAGTPSVAVTTRMPVWRAPRRVSLTGEIDDTVAHLIVAQLLHLESDEPAKDINLYINSPGGVVTSGMIEADGSISRGSQNLPGNWESSRFNLAKQLRALIPRIGDREIQIVMHNDAVVQGLSERPFTKDVSRWAVLTIGTGLGNACFANRDGSAQARSSENHRRRTRGRDFIRKVA